jgi:hypothetical protein
VLTEAARLRITRGYGTSSEHLDQADFADFLAGALAATAANLGGIEDLLAGRSGSWEADCVRQLLVGTVGEDEAYLFEHRSEPLVIRVHAADILNDLGWWRLYDEAEDELARREEQIIGPVTRGNTIYSDELSEDAHAAWEDIARLRERLDEQRESDFAAYGAAVTEQVRAAVAQLLPDLPVPVQVVVDTDWHNDLDTGEFGYGLLAQVWQSARLATPVPGSGIALRDYPDPLNIAQAERDAGRTPLARLEREAGEQ